MPVAFITGAAKGLGKAIALRLADDGFDIVVSDLASEDVSSVVDEIKAKGRKALGLPADVTSAEQVEAAVQKAVEELGGIDVMVANAGIGFFGSFLELTEAEFDRVINVNVKGVFNSFHAAAKQMVKQGRGGRLIAASSAAGKAGVPMLTPYATSKWAVRGLTLSLARELGHYGITANCYCPGFIETPMTVNPLTGKVGDAISSHVARLPIPRIGQPEEVANAVSFLASEKAAYITGQSLGIDGGDTAF